MTNEEIDQLKSEAAEEYANVKFYKLGLNGERLCSSENWLSLEQSYVRIPAFIAGFDRAALHYEAEIAKYKTACDILMKVIALALEYWGSTNICELYCDSYEDVHQPECCIERDMIKAIAEAKKIIGET